MRGQVVDASGLDAIIDPARDASHWLMAAHLAATPLYLPALALAEVRGLRGHQLTRIQELYEVLDYPSVLRGELDPDTADAAVALLAGAGAFDVGAAHVLVVARDRAWPVITADPDRLRRIDPDVEVLLV